MKLQFSVILINHVSKTEKIFALYSITSRKSHLLSSSGRNLSTKAASAYLRLTLFYFLSYFVYMGLIKLPLDIITLILGQNDPGHFNNSKLKKTILEAAFC